MNVFTIKEPSQLLVTLLVAAVCLGPSNSVFAHQAHSLSLEQITNEVNIYRTIDTVAPLSLNSALSIAAQAKADEMARTGDFSHNLSSGKTPWSFMIEAGYCYQRAAENLAVHYTDSAELVAAWMDSVSHRNNLMNDAYYDMGIGIAPGTWQGHKGFIIVQLFGAELTSEYQPQFSHCNND